MNDTVEFFSILRNIFGICPCCGTFFRLSDCRIFLQSKPRKDWKERLEAANAALDGLQLSIFENERTMRDEAALKGRREAQRAIKKIDSIFTPLRLHADDAKVLCHPIDYVVFDGMKSSEDETVKSIVLLDRERSDFHRRHIQKSIENVVERGNYDWVTMRVGADGSIRQE